MVQGIGIDIVAVSRIKKLMDLYGTNFLEKVFTGPEIEYCSGKAHPEIHFSGRWAGKEAFYKALPDQLQSVATWKGIEILSETARGRPVIRFIDTDFRERCTESGLSRFHLSISHEHDYCTAMVFME
ncbi:MAG: holo-ACP synthase [Chitinispirillaceae bacterium]|nr:holo-ACP synthase [Chitinispirillaceae bacterium]